MKKRIVSIAGVCLRTASELPLDPNNPGYSSFLAVDSSSSTSTIDIRVTSAPIPADRGSVLYDHDGHWLVRTDTEGYCIDLTPPNDKRACVVAYSNADTSQVRVYRNRSPEEDVDSQLTFTSGAAELLDNLLLVNHLASRGGVLVHAAGAVIEGAGLALAGVSTAGKSTISRLLVDGGFGGGILGDDRVILRADVREDGQCSEATIWSTPWTGDLDIAPNTSAPLAAFLFLVKAPVTKMVPISAAEAMRRLMPLVSGPWYSQVMGKSVLDTCGQVVEKVPCFDLHFRPDQEVVELLASHLRR